MAAASLVLVSHAFLVTAGEGALEPLQGETGVTLGRYCVNVFFGISGLLIARSFDRRASMTQFVLAG